jgi:hypothetical protein
MNADKPKPLKHGGTLRYARGQAPEAEETKPITKKEHEGKDEGHDGRQRKSSQNPSRPDTNLIVSNTEACFNNLFNYILCNGNIPYGHYGIGAQY